MKSHEIDTKQKRYDFGSIRSEFYIKNNVEKDSQTLVSRISGCTGKVAGIFFFSMFGLKKSSGDKAAAVPYTSRHVDFISDMNSGPVVDLLVEYFV